MVVVPTDLVDGKIVLVEGLLILSRIGSGALMDFTFLGTNNKDIGVKLVEVKAKTTSQTNKGNVLFVGFSSELETDHLLWLQLVFHQNPVHHSTVGTDRVEIDVLGHIWVPSDLPNWIGMFLGPYIGAVNWLLMLVTDIVHQYFTVIQTNGQQGCALWMEVQTHDTLFCGEMVFGPFEILDRVNAHGTTSSLTFELVVTVTDGEQVLVSW